MSAIFRPMFVEVAESLLEAAAIEAQERKAREAAERAKAISAASRAAALHFNFAYDAARVLVENINPAWSMIEIYQESEHYRTIMRVRMPCQHVGWFLLDEHVMLAGIVDYIYDTLSEPPTRKCYCVQHEPQPPCTRGSCE